MARGATLTIIFAPVWRLHFWRTLFADTIVISPRVCFEHGTGCRDTLGPNEVNWPCGGDSWRSGGTATNNAQLTSYDFMDAIRPHAGAQREFSNLKAIVISGHSAGGQFVTRYEMSNQVHESISIPVTYVVANPSSYSYLDPDGLQEPTTSCARLRRAELHHLR